MPTILLIDDNESILEFYSGVLKNKGHSVMKATGPRDGLNRLANQRFDLVITDLELAKIGGTKIVEMILENNLNQTTPVIISSGYIDNQVIDHFSKNKRIHFLPKSVAPKGLLDIVT